MGFGSGAGEAINEMRRQKARELCLCYEVCKEDRPGWVECWEECPTILDFTGVKSRCNERDDP